MRQDTIEDIQMCLSCGRERCTNCLQEPRTGAPARMGRPPKTVARMRGGKVEHFDGVAAAGRAMGCSGYFIRTAIKSGKTFCGYRWSYI